MSTFWIFAACLTLAYAIYYTVVICIDLYGKPKDQRQTSVETFSIDDIAPEASVAVEKTDDGYRIGKTASQPDQEPQWEEKPIVPSIKKDETSDQPATSSPAKQKIETTQNEMEEIEPKMSTELMSIVMKAAIETGKPPVPIKKEVIKADSANPTSIQNETNNNEVIDRL